ncbi:hypothetical protein BT69DRAFT_1279165 [Atractiella rhizophila]|nr:hypothetical protein BT69DRAFT_1279165 [Atractiella rhizophila]
MLSPQKLQEEAEFVRRQLGAISSQKQKYSSDFTPPASQWPKRIHIFDIPLVDPPEPTTGEEMTGIESSITLNLKSLKPPLTFTLSSCAPTSTISSLKARLHEQEDGVPPPEQQRWLLKGKVISDSKLLKEYDGIKDGETITLMATGGGVISASTTPKPKASDSEAMDVDPPLPSSSTSAQTAPKPTSDLKVNPSSIPTFSLSATPSSPSVPISNEDLIHSTPQSPSVTASVPHSLLARFQNPDFWVETLDFLRTQFRSEGREKEEGEWNATAVWEQWFESGKCWLSPSDIALIRDRTGISSMGGL